MQIGPSNPLTFISGGTTPKAGATNVRDKDVAASPADSISSNNNSSSTATATPAQDTAGVILTLRSEVAAPSGTALPTDLVYANSPKTAATPDTHSDTERLALQHSQALARSVDKAASLRVDKDGVLVAKPASAAEIKAKEFVHFAVSAMRDYADAQDRLKQAEAASTTLLIPRSLGDMQKLTARFKLFV